MPTLEPTQACPEICPGYVGLYKVAVSDPEFAKTRVRVQLPIVREFDGAKWSEPAYAVGDRIERGQFSVEITDEAIIVHV
jgi:hypothetical protein